MAIEKKQPLLKEAEVTPSENFHILVEGAKDLGVFLSEPQIASFQKYLVELKSWGEKVNLISRKNEREIIIKDFIDSLSILRYISPGSKILDFGSGAGFPGVPLKIAQPGLRVVLSEAVQKRVFFLKHLVRTLYLEKTEVQWAKESIRAEVKCPGRFDFVISRAFGSIKNFSEVGLPLLKENGILLAMKGKKGIEELNEQLPRLERWGTKLAFVEKLRLPFLGHERVLIGLKKK